MFFENVNTCKIYKISISVLLPIYFYSQITNCENVLWFYLFSGHIYGWGENTYGQASPQYTLSVCSMPKLISLPTGETATDISAISYGSFVLTDIGTVYILGQ